MIKIIAVGKIKEDFFRNAICEYQKRISKYSKMEIFEVNDYPGYESLIELNREKEEIIKHISSKDFIVTLEVDGEEINSMEFSRKIELWQMKSANICFIIGGSNGLHEEIKKMSNYHLSFSKLTFPHQLFRIILLEQIYRSFKIINNETYHK